MTIAEILKAKGISDDVAQAVLDEMKANKIFTASEENLDIRYGKLKTDHEGNLAKLTEAEKLIANLQKTSKDNEVFQKQISEHNAKMEQLQTELEQTKLDSAIKVELLASKALDVDYLTFKLKEKGELSLDEDGKIKGWDDKLSSLKTQFPTQFETAATKNIIENKLSNGDNSDTAITKEEFNKMGYNSRVAFKQTNPEQYSQFMKG